MLKHLIIFFVAFFITVPAANAVEYKFTDNDLYYVEFIPKNANKESAIIFLHGNPSSQKWVKKMLNPKSDMITILDKISETSHKMTFAIARPGFNKSKGKLSKDLHESFSRKHVDEIVKAINYIAATHGIKQFTLFGFSVGAVLSAEIVMQHPELFEDVVLFDGGYDTVARARRKMGKSVTYSVNPMSTLKKVTPPNIPFTIYYTTKKMVYTKQYSIQFAELLKEKGVEHVDLQALNCGHFGFFDVPKIQKDLIASFAK